VPVANGDIKALSKFLVSAKKTAERIVVELKDKIGAAGAWELPVHTCALTGRQRVNALSSRPGARFQTSRAHDSFAKRRRRSACSNCRGPRSPLLEKGRLMARPRFPFRECSAAKPGSQIAEKKRKMGVISSRNALTLASNTSQAAWIV